MSGLANDKSGVRKEPELTDESQELVNIGSRLFGKMFIQFQDFVTECARGKRIQLHGLYYVAVDRKQWNEIQHRLNPTKVIVDEATDLAGEHNASQQASPKLTKRKGI